MERGSVGSDQKAPGEAMSMGQHLIDKGASMLQSLTPIKQFGVHACSFAIYSHDMSRQIETHHFKHRVNKDFCQCAIYDTDDRSGRLIGVEYVISQRLFDSLPPDEQKLWHSHLYEVKSGLLVTPRVPEMAAMPDLQEWAKTYGKCFCTWQIDRGDLLPIGEPALMVAPQAEPPGIVHPSLVAQRDTKYHIDSISLSDMRANITGPTMINPNADYWKRSGKGFAIDVVPTEMKKITEFP